MEITTKELRIQPGKIIDQVVNGHDITITFRGKALARIVPLAGSARAQEHIAVSIFGMWKDHSHEGSVEDSVREMREGRQF